MNRYIDTIILFRLISSLEVGVRHLTKPWLESLLEPELGYILANLEQILRIAKVIYPLSILSGL